MEELFLTMARRHSCSKPQSETVVGTFRGWRFGGKTWGFLLARWGVGQCFIKSMGVFVTPDVMKANKPMTCAIPLGSAALEDEITGSPALPGYWPLPFSGILPALFSHACPPALLGYAKWAWAGEKRPSTGLAKQKPSAWTAEELQLKNGARHSPVGPTSKRGCRKSCVFSKPIRGQNPYPPLGLLELH